MASPTKLDQKKNFSLATTVTPLGSGDTSWTLDAGQGALLPDTANGAFDAVIWDQTSSPDNPFRSSAGFELVRVVTRAGDSITSMTRAQQGTSAIALTVGPSFAIAAVPTALDWDNVRKMIQEDATNFGVTGGTVDAIELTLDPVPTAYIDGAKYRFQATGTNTVDDPTLNVNSLGAKQLRDVLGTKVLTGTFKASGYYTAVYRESADRFHLLATGMQMRDLANNSLDSATSSFAAGTYTLTQTFSTTSSPDNTANSVIRFVADADNTGATDIIIAGAGGAQDLLKKNGAELEAGEIKSGDVVEIARRVASGAWQLMSAGVTGGETNTASNVGTGDGWFKQKTGTDLEFKTVVAGDGIAVTNNTDDLTISKAQDDYISAYDTTVQTLTAINTFQDVTFDTNGEIDGWTHTASSADFTCPTTAFYLITYRLATAKTGGGSQTPEARLTVNGTEVAGTASSGVLSGNSIPYRLTATKVVSLTASDIVRVQFTSDGAQSEIRTTGANATTPISACLTITKI